MENVQRASTLTDSRIENWNWAYVWKINGTKKIKRVWCKHTLVD